MGDSGEQVIGGVSHTGIAPPLPEEAPPVAPPLVIAALARYMSPATLRKPGAAVSAPVMRKGRRGYLSTPLSRIMRANGHTAQRVAQYLGCGTRTVENWTTGTKVIPPRHLAKLCELYGRDAEWFTKMDEWDGVVVTDESRRIAEEFFSQSGEIEGIDQTD